MYRAKRDGKARIAVFDRSMEARAIERLEVETELRSALERGEFEVYYQPIFSLADQRITEFEALVRWRKPDGRLVLPINFIPLAEETGLDRAARAMGARSGLRSDAPVAGAVPERPAAGHQRQPLGASISESAPDRGRRSTRLTRTGLDPHSLKLEITESVAMHDPEATATTLRALKALGLRLGDRRLRDGLFQSELPAALPGGHAQDRSLVRRRARAAIVRTRPSCRA